MKKNIRKIKTPGESTLKTLLKFGQFAFTKPGFDHFKRTAARLAGFGTQRPLRYDNWIKAEKDVTKLTAAFNTEISGLRVKPRFTIVLFVNIASTELFYNSFQSISNQLYKGWELCIFEKGAKKIARAEFLKEYKNDHKITVVENADGLTNVLAKSGGDYILWVENGDMLTLDCLFEFVKYINTHPSGKLLYADEDYINEKGDFSSPKFKPDLAPDNLLSGNYIGSTLMISNDLLTKLSEIRTADIENDLSQLLLNSIESANIVGHIPKILFHKQRNDTTNVSFLNTNASLVDYNITKPGTVSIIIPTKDHEHLLKTAIDSIIEKTDYQDYEIIIVNNNSVSEDFYKLMAQYELQLTGRFSCIEAKFPFNFSKLINLGVSVSQGKYILMLNNDVEVIHADWLTKMVSYAQREKTGAVGVKLLYPDDTIQHAGIVLSGNEASSHIYANAERYDSRANRVTNYSAVTGACLMCRKEVYSELGGMDEQLPVEYNDIDLCLKMLCKGYYNVYLPQVELYHFESATRGHPFRSKKAWKQHNHDLTVFKNKWQKMIDRDPYYNPLSALFE